MRRPESVAVPSPVREASVRFVVTIVLAAVALLVFASPAHAQLGRLKKAASDAVKEAAGVPKEDAGRSGSSSSSKPFEATITPERVDLMIAALTPLTEEARKESMVNEQRASFTAKRKTWEKCATDAANRVTSISPAYLEKVPEFTEKSTALTQRLIAAQKGKMGRLAAAIEDSMQVLGNLMSLSMSGAKCGPAVYKPIAVIEADVARREASGGEVGEDGRYVSHGGQYTLPESARRGLTHHQFSVLRERIALYAMGEIGKSRESNFSPEERAALDAKGDELRALGPFFRDGTLRWSNGGDLKRW